MKIGHSTNKEDLWPYWAAIEPIRVRNAILTDRDEIGKSRDARIWLTETFGQPGFLPDSKWNSTRTRFWFKAEEDLMVFLLRFG